MASEVRIAPEAKEQLRSVRHSYVIAEILDLIYRDLRVPPLGGGLDGVLPRRSPAMWWRRALPLSELDDFLQIRLDDEDEDSCQACDYVILYREMTPNERIRFQISSSRPVLVVGIYPNTELVKSLRQ